MCLQHNITNAFVIYDIIQEKQLLIDQHFVFYKTELTSEFKIALIVMCVFNTGALFFLINLITFHIELRYKGLTTYEFLKMKENITKDSKIVIKVTKEMREEMDREERDRVKIKAGLDQLRITLEQKAAKAK